MTTTTAKLNFDKVHLRTRTLTLDGWFYTSIHCEDEVSLRVLIKKLVKVKKNAPKNAP